MEISSIFAINDTKLGDITILTLELSLGITGVIGNLLVCITIFGANILHSKTNFFISSLAVADLLVCLLALLFNNEVLNKAFRFTPKSKLAQEIFCRVIVNKYLFWATAISSTYNLVGVTLERFVAIVFPFKYPSIYTKRRVKYMFCTVWIFAYIAKSDLVIFTFYNSTNGMCAYDIPSQSIKIFVSIWALSLTYVIPLCALVIMYIKIILTLRRSENNQRQMLGGQEMSSAKWKVVRILLIVSITYVIFWTPAELIFVGAHFDFEYLEASATLRRIFFIFPLANSVVNPVIYCLKYKQFRKGIAVVFCLYKRSKKLYFISDGKRKRQPTVTTISCDIIETNTPGQEHPVNANSTDSIQC